VQFIERYIKIVAKFIDFLGENNKFKKEIKKIEKLLAEAVRKKHKLV